MSQATFDRLIVMRFVFRRRYGANRFERRLFKPGHPAQRGEFDWFRRGATVRDGDHFGFNGPITDSANG